MRRIYRVFTATSYIAFLFLLITTGVSLANEAEYTDYEFPYIEPAISLAGGYRFVDHSGSEMAGEYEYLHNSISLGGELRVFTYPHRLHIDADLRNKKDYFGELRYAYKDILYFRGINRTLVHNLDNIRFSDLDTTTLSPGVDIRDADKRYDLQSGITSFFLRFKNPDFPSHIYLGGSILQQDGDQQQKSISGSGYFNNIVRTSQSRDVDRQTKNIIVGLNSHLGTIEMDISHEEKRLDIGGDHVLYDPYGDAQSTGDPSGSVRSAGIFPHNLIPELKGSTNTINIHSSYTGSLVASATFTNTKRENSDSNAKADYVMAAGNIVWMPMPKLTFFLKYKHNERDMENIDTVAVPDVCSPLNNVGNNYSCIIKPALSSITDRVSGIVRYRPVKGIILITEYSFEEIERENSDRWGLPGSTKTSALSLAADMRILKGVNIKSDYLHKDKENPAYNTEADRLDEARLSVTWMYGTRFYSLLSYTISKEMRDDLDFNDNISAKDRDMRKDRFLGSITTHLSNDISLTTSYLYMRNKVNQDIHYRSGITPEIFLSDPSVPYQDSARDYSVVLSYAPEDNMSFDAGISHTIIKGTFYPSEQDLTGPVSVAAFSEFKANETVYSAGGEYRFRTGYTTGLKYKYMDINEVSDNPHDDITDGKLHVFLLTISKRW